MLSRLLPTSFFRPLDGRLDASAVPELGRAALAEQAVVSDLLQIACAMLTLEITFEAASRSWADGEADMETPPPPTPVPAGAARLDAPVVLRDGHRYGTLRCISEARRTPVGSRPADALRCVAVLVGKELDRHRRRSGATGVARPA